MAYNRERISIGQSANDNKGTDLHQTGKILEDFMSQVCMFLNGGVSEVTIPNSLSEFRGGTGASTLAELQDFVLRNGAKSFSTVVHKYVPVAVIYLDETNQFTKRDLVSLSKPMTLTHESVGVYIMDLGNSLFEISRNKGYVTADKCGNQLFGYTLTKLNGQTYRLNTYAMFDGQTFTINEDKPIDIPKDNDITFYVVNTASTI